MQTTAHFEKDFFTVITDAKRQSAEPLGGRGKNAVGPRRCYPK
ncbi:hypothetical protein [Bradyrhizobium australafricanum]|nr:hypothetical protein [Bradyrhizobium australafricanum]